MSERNGREQQARWTRRAGRGALLAACGVVMACSNGCSGVARDAASTEAQTGAVNGTAAWVAKHGLSAADYQAEFNTLVAQGYRLTCT